MVEATRKLWNMCTYGAFPQSSRSKNNKTNAI